MLTEHRVKEHMTSNPGTVRENEPVSLAQRLMSDNKFHHMPVVNALNKVVGILSDRDIKTAIEVNEATDSPREVLVKDIMTTEVETITPEDTLQIAASFMVDYRFNALPVVQNGEIVGIITSTDLLKAFLD